MTLAPLMNAPLAIQLHAFAAMAAFVLALVQFAGVKGSGLHRVLGWIWILLMLMVAVSSFWISEIDQWRGFSFIHLLSIYTLIGLVIGVYAARRARIDLHRKNMVGIFIGGLLIAGALTFAPGRRMHDVVMGQGASLDGNGPSARR